MKKITVKALRKRFPEPVTLIAARHSGSTTQYYCVGGALAKALDAKNSGFPVHDELVGCLRFVNPNFRDIRTARRYAQGIIAKNDYGQFDEAWAALDKALRFVGRKQK